MDIVVRDIIAKADISINQQQFDEVVKALVPHIESVIFNVAAIASTMAAMDKGKKVELAHVDGVRNYITSTCKIVGGSMPSDYFGVTHAGYSAANAGGTVMSQIDFEGGVARPELLSQLGGGAGRKRADPIAKRISEVVKEHKLSLPKASAEALLNIVRGHISCLVNDLRKVEPVTVKKLQRVLATKRHAVFN
jgi:hypothetical protein